MLDTITSFDTTIRMTIPNDAWLAAYHEGCQRYKYLELYSAKIDFWHRQLKVGMDPEWFDICHRNFNLCMDRWEHLHDTLIG